MATDLIEAPTSSPARMTVATVNGALVRYGVPASVAILLTFRWFAPGTFIAAGDVSPFVRTGLRAELWSGWSHQLSPAGSGSYEMTRLFDILVSRAVGVVGGSPESAQHVQFALITVFAAVGVAFWVGTVVRHDVIAAACGVLAVANPLVMVSLPLTMPLLLLGTAAFSAGILARAPRHGAVWLAVASMPMSYMAINPPTLAVAVAWIPVAVALTALLGGAVALRNAVLLLMRAIPLVLVFNLWWVGPLLVAYVGGGLGSDVTAITDPDSWSWVHVNNSIGNVATLRAHWGWGTAQVLPSSLNLDTPPWSWMMWILPIAAAFSPIVAPAHLRKFAVTLLAIAAVLVIVGKGLHPPLPGLNRWLYDHLPGFWLLRDPVNKIGPLLLLAQLSLLALTIDGINRHARRLEHPRRSAAHAGVAAVIVAAAVAPVALWTGDVVSDERGQLPSSRVALPDEWRDVAAVIHEANSAGKVLVLPLGSFYQLTTTWGYHGVDNVAAMLLDRPVLQRLPGGYFGAPAEFEQLLSSIEDAARKADPERLAAAARALGASHVIVRRDLTEGQISRPRLDPAVITQTLDLVEDAERIHRSSLFDVYEFHGSDMVSVGIPVLVDDDDAGMAASYLTADETAVPLDEATRPRAQRHLLAPGGTRSITTSNSQTFDLRMRGDALDVTAERNDDGRLVRATSDATVAVDGERIPPAVASFRTTTQPVVIEHTDGTLELLEPGTTTTVHEAAGRGSGLKVWNANSAASPLVDWSPVGDCNRFDERDLAASAISARTSPTEVHLTARAHSACVWSQMPNLTDAPAVISLRYRTAGAGARLCVWHPDVNSCVTAMTLPPSLTWSEHSVIVPPGSGADTDRLLLYVYADGPDDGTVGNVTYQNVAVHPLATIEPDGQEMTFAATIRVDGTAQVANGDESNAWQPLTEWSDLEDCFAIDTRDHRSAGLSVAIRNTTVSLRAQAHAACIHTPIASGPLSDVYELVLDHRTLIGRPARLCIWQVGPDRCADAPTLDTGTDFKTFRTFIRPDPGTTELELYLYADGPDSDGDETVVEYRNAAVRRVAGTALVAMPQPAAATLPAVRYQRRSPAEFTVDITGADGTFVLTLADTHADGWQVHGLPDGWEARHVVANGYANGWIITGRGDARLVLRYGPDRLVRLSATVSAAGLVAVPPLMLLVSALRRRQSRDRPRDDEA